MMAAQRAGGTVRIGVVGLGRLGRRHAWNLATRVGEATVVAACSPVEAERDWVSHELGVGAVYADYGELLRHPGLDAVFLVTPNSLHAQQSIDALRAGKHVFCEKPLALDIDACLRVETEAAKHPAQKVMVGFVRRFDPSYRSAWDRIRAGGIGRPFAVRSQTADRYDPSGFFVKFSAGSGGILLDMTIHDVDLARWYLGSPEPKRVFAAGTTALHPELEATQDADNAVAILQFADGSLAHFTASRTLAHGHETMTEIVGTEGRLTVGRNPWIDRVEIADRHGMRNESTPTFWERFEEAFVHEAHAFCRCVLDGSPPPLGLRDATEATRIGIALMQSLRSGQAVELGPLGPELSGYPGLVLRNELPDL